MGLDNKNKKECTLVTNNSENLTSGMSRPCVMDIKLGRITWPYTATKETIARKSKKAARTVLPYGFALQGMALASTEGVKRLTKKDADSLDVMSVHTILENFLGEKNATTVCLATSFQKKLKDFEGFFESQTAFHNFASSLLCVYDQGVSNSAKVHIIDFGHAFPGNGKKDDNLLFGLKNVRALFDEYLAA